MGDQQQEQVYDEATAKAWADYYQTYGAYSAGTDDEAQRQQYEQWAYYQQQQSQDKREEAGGSSYGGGNSYDRRPYGDQDRGGSRDAPRDRDGPREGSRGDNSSFGDSSRSSIHPQPAEGKSDDTIYISGLPLTVTETQLVDHFKTIGIIKTDKKLRPPGPKVWIYKDKVTQMPKGDATVTYEDPPAAQAAVSIFNGKPFPGGGNLTVVFADSPASKFAAAGGAAGGG
ncbi:hypothetical protein HDU76_006232, partial [Blyttiomyces sp. JEL0837]